MFKVGTPGGEVLALTGDPAANYGLGDDRIDGLNGNDTITTGAGDDYLNGGQGNDRLFDGDGDDTVVAGEGNDVVQADAGNDSYFGGDGIDNLWFDWIHYGAFDTSETAKQGITLDLALTSAQNLGEFGIDLFIGFENVVGTYGNDTIYGASGSNDLYGYMGDDLMDGRGGNDSLAGGAGADTLVGGLGQDLIEVGVDDGVRDIVRYGTLNDSSTMVATRDTIAQFVQGQDKIDLSKIDANLGLKGNQAFKVVKGFSSAFGEVKIVHQGADTLVQVDGDKDKAVDMTFLVKNAHLTKGDFIL